MLLNEHERPLAVHWRILILSWLGWLSVFATLMVFQFQADLYRVELVLDDGDVAWVKSLALGATGLGGIVFGFFGDHYGRKPAMAASLLICGWGVLGAAAAPSGEWLMAAAAVAGFGIGGQWASGQTLVGETVPPRLRARFGAISQSGAPLGLILGSLAAFEVGPALGWRNVFLLALLPGLLVPAIIRLIPESDLWLANRQWRRRGELPDRATVAEVLAPGVRGTVAVAFVLTLLTMANYWFVVTWLPEFMRRNWDLTIARSGQWTLVFASGSLVGYYLYSLAADALGRRPAFTLFSVLMAAGTAMLTIFETSIRGHPELVLLFAATAGVGTGVWSSFGPLYTEVFPTRIRATAGGFCMNVSRGLQILAPHVVRGVGGVRLQGGVALAALFALGAAATIWALPETRGRKLD